MHWAREVMNKATQQLIAGMDAPMMDAMEISGGHWSSLKWRSFVSLQYPTFDICAQPTDRECYDIIFAEQVFEHLAFPYRAVKNVYQLLRPHGWFLLTTPFLLKVHRCPLDCSRWTKQGLQYLLMEGGFRESHIQTFAWGNRACVIGNFEEWMDWDPERHSLTNEEDFPVVVWALARK